MTLILTVALARWSDAAQKVLNRFNAFYAVAVPKTVETVDGIWCAKVTGLKPW